MVSDALLCLILWQIVRDQADAEKALEDAENPVVVEIAEFDEEAELNAGIWNNFQRRRLAGGTEVDNRFLVRSSMFASRTSQVVSEKLLATNDRESVKSIN
jgi:hypothetical protein